MSNIIDTLKKYEYSIDSNHEFMHLFNNESKMHAFFHWLFQEEIEPFNAFAKVDQNH